MVNLVSVVNMLCLLPPGPLRSRAAKAIGFIDMMIDYSTANAPLQKELSAGNNISITNGSCDISSSSSIFDYLHN
jgi:enoyl-[acyl-carrier-protein] reductase (NADH)